MIFTSESGLTAPSRIGEWDEWYLGHLAAMVAVPGISSAQRFRALTEGAPPSLAMYTVASPAVFDSDIYRRTRGMGPFAGVVDERLHRRNLFDGLDAAPDMPMTGILLIADRTAIAPTGERASPGSGRMVWIDRLRIAGSRYSRTLRRRGRRAPSSATRSRCMRR
jgi:hypothetical protein